MRKRPPKRNRKHDLVRAFLLANPSASNADVSKGVLVSPSLASKVRTELRNEGFLKPLDMDRTSRPPFAPDTYIEGPAPIPTAPPSIETLEVTSTARLMQLAAVEEVKYGGNMPFEEQERMLIKFTKKEDESLATRMLAMDKLNKLRADQKGRDALGPGEPLDHAGMILRLSMLLKAVGFKLAVEAFEEAFKKAEASSGPAQTIDTEPTILPTEDSGPAITEFETEEIEEGSRPVSVGPEPGNGESGEHQNFDRLTLGEQTFDGDSRTDPYLD